jgi:hypothetical protein
MELKNQRGYFLLCAHAAALSYPSCKKIPIIYILCLAPKLESGLA